MSRLLVELLCQQPAAAVLDGNALLEYRALPKAGGIEAEQVYLGVADGQAPGIEATFVNLGNDMRGYLPTDKGQRVPSGARLLVQVKKPPVGGKLAYLTRDIALAGKTVILLPNATAVMASRRVEEAGREALLARGRALARGDMGLVMRSEARLASDEALTAELETLKALWADIGARAASASPPTLLYAAPSALEKLLRDMKETPDEILCDAPERLPEGLKGVRMVERPLTLFNVADKLEKSLRRHVWLNSGAYLVIDPCEAMTVFDVNTGKNRGGKQGLEETAYRVNCEAAREVARLARLRAMGGILLVDFIDMREETHRQGVLTALRDAFASDPVKTVIHGFTSLGLCEITRKRQEEALALLGEKACPRCGGTGVVREDDDAGA